MPSACDMHSKYADVVPAAQILAYYNQLPTDLFRICRPAVAADLLSRCRLQGRIERVEQPGPIPLGQRGRPAGVRPQLAEVPGYLTTGKRIADIGLRPMFSHWGDDTCPFLEAARRQRDVGGDAYVGRSDVLCNPVVGRVGIVADENHADIRAAWRPDRTRAVGDNENLEPKARRHAIDLLADRARITIDVNVSQPSAWILFEQISLVKARRDAMADLRD